MIAVAALAAGTAFAQEGANEYPAHKGKNWNCDGGGPPAWAQMDKRGRRPEGAVDPETMEQMRKIHSEIRDLAGAARLETDETRKADLVARLRAKLGEAADLMQAKQEKRLAQAEERLADLKAKIEYSKANREQMLDEQVQRVLAGEKPKRPEIFDRFPHAKGGMPPPPPPMEDDDIPPLMEDPDAPPPPPAEMPGDLPPPPGE
jgi:hypothetical protein